jgi:hypothetical protein
MSSFSGQHPLQLRRGEILVPTYDSQREDPRLTSVSWNCLDEKRRDGKWQMLATGQFVGVGTISGHY